MMHRIQFFGVIQKYPRQPLTAVRAEEGILIWLKAEAAGADGVKKAVTAFDDLRDRHGDAVGDCVQMENDSFLSWIHWVSLQ